MTSPKNTTTDSSTSSKPMEAKGVPNAFLSSQRQSTDTVSTLPEYTEKSNNNSSSSSSSSSKGIGGGGGTEISNTEPKKSRLNSAFDRMKAKVGQEEKPNDAERAEKEEKKAKRREEYEKLGLGDRTKYGVGGMGWSG